MAHKFAHKWTCYLVIDGQLRPYGDMDLRKIKINGELEDGDHHHGGYHEDIDGQATALGPIHTLALDADDESAHYDGVLVYDSNDKMMIAGIAMFSDERIRKEKLDQEDPPWIITKP